MIRLTAELKRAARRVDHPRVRRTVFLLVLAVLLGNAATARAADGKLERLGGDTWRVSGTLDGVTPPEYSTVRVLYVSRLRTDTARGLAPLAAFTDLRSLYVEHAYGLDLSPLAGLPLEQLSLTYVRGVDLTPLAALPALRDLNLFDLRDTTVPTPFVLPPALESFGVSNDGWKETGAPVKALIDAIDWTRLGALRSLGLRVGGLEPLEPITVDLGLLRSLPRLEYLDIVTGVLHRGVLPSPLAPPFDGLSRRLRTIRIEALRPSKVQRSLERRYPRAAVGVSRRTRYEPGHGSWTLYRSGGSWHTYGSVWEAFDGRYGETEYDALGVARRKLRRADPALLRRLDFDPESAGTGISAPTRRELVRTLEILGIR